MRGRMHEVTIAVGGKQIGGWIDYSFDVSMLSPASAFSLTRKLDREAWNLCETDAEIGVRIDGTPVLSGFIDDVKWSARAGTLAISGRDRSGRLVQESAPSVEFAGLSMSEVVKRLVDPWYKTVRLDGARDRLVRRGKRGHHAPSATEPVVIDSVVGRRIEPGDMRWSVIEEIVTQAGYLAWGAGDGKELVIAPPNYTQGVQYVFTPETCVELDGEVSTGDGYSQIQVIGSSRGTDADYGLAAASRGGAALDFPGPEGIGGDFQRPKRLVLVEKSVRNSAEAVRQAEREHRRRNQRRRTVVAECQGHGQSQAGAPPTIFTVNTLARVAYPAIGFDERYLVTGCAYSARRESENTRLQLVPRGTELSL